VPNFTPIGATCRPCGAKNLKIGLLSTLNTGRLALHAMLPVISKTTVTWKILFAISMEKDSQFYTPKISKFVDE